MNVGQATTSPGGPRDARGMERELAFAFLCARADNREDRALVPACGMADAALDALVHACGRRWAAEFLYQYADSVATRAPMPPLPRSCAAHFPPAPAEPVVPAPVERVVVSNDPQTEEVSLDWPSRAFIALGRLLERQAVKMALLALRTVLMAWGVIYFIESIRGV